MFVSAGWEPGNEMHLVRNWVKKDKKWGVQNMGEAKIDTATGDTCIKEFTAYAGLDGERFHNAWMRKTYSGGKLSCLLRLRLVT